LSAKISEDYKFPDIERQESILVLFELVGKFEGAGQVNTVTDRVISDSDGVAQPHVHRMIFQIIINEFQKIFIVKFFN
jgi:hypothetical protein